MTVQNAAPSNTNQMPTPPTDPVQDVSAPVVAPVPQPDPVQEPLAVPPVAPQPASQPVPEPAPEPTPVPETVPYTPTGNKALDAAAKIVATQGFDPMALSNEITETGELSAKTRADLVAKLGEDQVDILTATYSTEIVKVRNEASSKTQTVYDTVGGKEMWDQIADWTTKEEAGLSESAATEYNRMLAAGGVQAELAARALKEAYMSSPGFKQENPSMVQADGVVPAAVNIETISRPQYTAERKKAVREGNAAVVEQLDARARHTMEKVPNQWRINAVIN